MNAPQRSSEWFAERCGCLTASRAAAVIQRQKSGKPYAAYEQLIDQLLTERVTGTVEGSPVTNAMQWGIDHEDEARSMYEIETGNAVDQTGFVHHPDIDYFGASPDGLVGDMGLIEIKCPATTRHLARVASHQVPEEYKPQMLVQLLCTGRKWVDYVDYDPRLNGQWKSARLYIKRYEPTEAELQDAKAKCIEFLAAVDNRYQELKRQILT